MSLTTSALLKSLGAVEDPSSIQDEHAALMLRIGRYCFHGGEYMSRWFKRTYRISAVVGTRHSISLVESEMPAELESEDEGLAWLGEILPTHFRVMQACLAAEGRTFETSAPQPDVPAAR